MTLTDNSALDVKVELRLGWLDTLDQAEVRVLDCYGGEGVIWTTIQEQRPAVKIWRTGIEKVRGKGDRLSTLYGDNMQYLPTMDLAGYDAIDLDAYGWANAQLDVIVERCPEKHVFTTTGIHGVGAIPHDVVIAAGMDPSWADLIPGPLNKLGVDLWDEFLASRGYTDMFRAKVVKEGRDGRMVLLYDHLLPIVPPAPT